MPRYRYTATALSGKTLHGVTEAASAEALYITLREQDLYMTDAKEVGTNASVYRPLKTPELAEFCRGLGTLLSAGVPLVRAFRIMADERTIDARQKALYEAILSELRKGVPLSDAAKALTECVGVKGRCEVVPLDAPFTVIIDYAHTPDGLKNILSTVCGFADGRVIALFGCGGDRDRTKRPRCSHERQSPHRRPLRHPARCAPRTFGEQNAVRRHREPARGHRLCSARGESARRRRPLRQGARDLSGDRNDKIPPRREGGRAREVRASTKEGRRRRGEGKRT